MDRGKKSQLPCAQGMNGVSSPDGPPGLDSYHFLATYGATEWTPRMMSMETIPLTKKEEKDWAYFATATLSYCYAEKKMDFGKSPNALLFNAQGKEGLRVDPGVEAERLAMVMRAIHNLYGKRGIRFFPTRADQQMGHDEFLIPGFGFCSRRDWTTTHFVVVLGDAPWALTAGELELSRNLKVFYRKASMKSIGSGGGLSAPSKGTPTVIPDGFRKAFRKAKPGGSTVLTPRGQAAQTASSSASGAAASGPATTYAPDPAAASGPATTYEPDPEWDRGDWEPRHRGDANTWRDQGWEQGHEWSTDPAPNKGKGKGSTKGRGKKGKRADKSRSSTDQWVAGGVWWYTTASGWDTADAAQQENSEETWSWLFPVLLIFMVGALCGGLIGYLIGYIKHHKIIYIPKAVRHPPPPPTIETDRPRPRRQPQEAPPQIILTTITGDRFHLVGRCGVQRVSTNRCLTPCGTGFSTQQNE